MCNLDPTHDDPVLAIRDAHRGWPCSCRPFAFAEDGCMRPLGHSSATKRMCVCPLPSPQPHPGHARRGRPIRRRHCTPFVVLLQETNVHVFLLLNGGNVPSGLSLSVVCVGPRLGGNKLLEYELQDWLARAVSVGARGVRRVHTHLGGAPPNGGFLLVPDTYWNSSGAVSISPSPSMLGC
ncbi:hypothetical protein HU200_008450 [Digitaria exilis]|uniref:Uncharacterized protein n=1 Tax=Digitaria exilis TaxID=1010633 RepID=A0A835KNX6_9POAL|nr:hypothetical protein HU200_008450 [Digitaria exilis]